MLVARVRPTKRWQRAAGGGGGGGGGQRRRTRGGTANINAWPNWLTGLSCCQLRGSRARQVPAMLTVRCLVVANRVRKLKVAAHQQRREQRRCDQRRRRLPCTAVYLRLAHLSARPSWNPAARGFGTDSLSCDVAQRRRLCTILCACAVSERGGAVSAGAGARNKLDWNNHTISLYSS